MKCALKEIHMKRIAIVIVWQLVAGTLLAADINFSGYYKSFFTVLKIPEIKNSTISYPELGLVSNRLRLQTFYKPFDWFSLGLAYDLAFKVQDPLLFISTSLIQSSSTNNYRISDLKAIIYPKKGEPISSFAAYQNLDRAYINISTSYADITLGRQPIAWGSAHAISSTDIITPFRFDALDTEDRIGVDAIRLLSPLGLLGELDAGVIAGKDFKKEKSAAYLRAKVNILNTDFALMSVLFSKNIMYGLDLTRNIKGATAWIEAAFTAVNDTSTCGCPKKNDYLRVTVGSDYSFLDAKLYVYCEYHFNSAGKVEFTNYSENQNSIPYQEGGVYLQAEHYLIPGLSYQLTPLMFLNGQAMLNLNDGSSYLSTNLNYNIKEDMYLDFGIFLGLGSKPAYSKNPELVGQVISSEFGNYPLLVYSSFGIYF
jgi:hypothetical protein